MFSIFRIIIIIGLLFPYLANATSVNNPPARDVVIIGGGISGLYSGYRLVSSQQTCKTCQALLQNSTHASLNVELFEMSNRLGGRIWSLKIPGTEHLIAELGAMRFLEFQANLVNLLKQFHLESKIFDDTYNLMYFRGHVFSVNDLKNKDSYPNKVPYFLPANMRGLTPGQILHQMSDKLFPDSMVLFDDAKYKRLLIDKQINGKLLIDWSLENILVDQFDNETMNFVTDVLSGPGPLFDSLTAYTLLTNVGRPVTTKVLSMPNGMQQLPLALADAFQKKGGVIHNNVKLYTFSIVNAHDGKLIKLELGPPELHHPNQIIYTKILILALPKKSLSLLTPTPALFNSEFLNNMDSVVALPLSKLFVTYSDPWWEHLKILSVKAGESVSALPLQNTFYFGSEQTNSKSNISLLLASYNTDGAFRFWENYFSPNTFNYSDNDANAVYINQLPQYMPDELTRQLSLLHNEQVPAYINSYYMNWNQNPFGGGVHTWKVHINPLTMAPYMRSPFKDTPVYIVGEAYSSYQGWIEGAINSAELLLEQQFGMQKAAWIPADYDLGF